MLFNHKYPYTDFHELNLDWLLNTVKEVKQTVDEIYKNVDKAVAKWIQDHINDIMVHATYIPETETIKFASEIIVGGDMHVYDSADTSMHIE